MINKEAMLSALKNRKAKALKISIGVSDADGKSIPHEAVEMAHSGEPSISEDLDTKKDAPLMSDDKDKEEDEKELGTAPEMSHSSDVKDDYAKDESMVHGMMAGQHDETPIDRPKTIKEKTREALAMKMKSKGNIRA